MTTKTDPFYDALNGRFTSIMEWHQLAPFWNVVRQNTEPGWYIYAVGEPPPDNTASPEELDIFITEIDSLLRKEHKEDYCGIVFADNPTHPAFVKIYDPNNLGVVCGFSTNPPPPGWILSKLQPKALEGRPMITGQRRRWWQRLWD